MDNSLNSIAEELQKREAELLEAETTLRQKRHALDEDKCAFERVVALVNRGDASQIEPSVRSIEFKPPFSQQSSSPSRKTVKATVEDCLNFVSTNAFDINDVVNVLKQRAPGLKIINNKQNISSLLRKWLDAGKLELVELGKGKRAARYRKI